MKWIWRKRRYGTGHFGPRYQRNYELARAFAAARVALLFIFMSFVLAMLLSTAR